MEIYKYSLYQRLTDINIRLKPILKVDYLLMIVSLCNIRTQIRLQSMAKEIFSISNHCVRTQSVYRGTRWAVSTQTFTSNTQDWQNVSAKWSFSFLFGLFLIPVVGFARDLYFFSSFFWSKCNPIQFKINSKERRPLHEVTTNKFANASHTVR